MARILYFSTHEALEYDELRLFIDMGHVVFSLGKYCQANTPELSFRPPLSFPPATDALVELFQAEGCHAAFTDLNSLRLTATFLNSFDFIISIQDVGFIAKIWDLIDGPVVVWRTVGQAIEHLDAQAEVYRQRGLKIVRWSNREHFADTYIGHDAIIRAYKDETEFGPWTGGSGRVITFSNGFEKRYPIEHGLFQRVVYLMKYGVGGVDNDGVPGAIGLISAAEMKTTMNEAAAYFYMHGSVVPYTLNFVEAFMTGVPVLCAGRNVQIHNIDMRFNEINDFIVHGRNGFVFKSEQQARGILMNLMLDRAYATMIGAHGRQTAIRLFGKQRAMADWEMFFAAHVHR